MGTQVDVQMPIRKGGFITGDVIQRLLMQNAEFTLYVDAGEDFEFSEAHERLLGLTATSHENAEWIKCVVRAAFKRNRLRTRGSGPYVYLADPDVLLPTTPLFGGMIRAFKENPQLGAIGARYQDNDHLACGSMMLRRRDFMRIGPFRGAGISCECNYICKRLEALGMKVVLLKSVPARHLKSEYTQGYTEHTPLLHQLSADGVLQKAFLERMLQRHGPRFKLYCDTP